jgi:PAS domain S-box-containing protein
VQNADKTQEQLLQEIDTLQQRVATLETRYHEARSAFQKADEKYRDLFENAGDSIFIIDAATHRILDANANAARRLGYTPEELLQLTLDQIEVHGDEAVPDEEISWESTFSGAQFYECSYRRKDGSLIPVEVSSSQIMLDRDRVLQNFVRDITKRREIEAARRLAEAEVMRLATVIEQASETILMTDLSGNITYANPHFEITSGYKVEEAIGKNPRILKSGVHEQAFYRGLWETITSGNSWHGTFTNRSRNGDLYYEEAAIFPIRDLDGQITHYAEVTRDITERIIADQERENLIGELDAFAHTVAHDLKSPLALVLGYSSMLNDAFDSSPIADVREMLQTIEYGSQKMSKIIDELLLFASTRQLTDVKVAPLNMVAIIDESLSRLRLTIEEHQAEIVIPNAETWPVASGYAPWLEEVWANYISNAIKYGGTPPRIELGATREGDALVRFWVRDNGAGLSPEQQSNLFKMYSRLETKKIEGHGLGLSIVQRIVNKLGGQVGVESVVGQGSTFSFTLPIYKEV